MKYVKVFTFFQASELKLFEDSWKTEEEAPATGFLSKLFSIVYQALLEKLTHRFGRLSHPHGDLNLERYNSVHVELFKATEAPIL